MALVALAQSIHAFFSILTAPIFTIREGILFVTGKLWAFSVGLSKGLVFLGSSSRRFGLWTNGVLLAWQQTIRRSRILRTLLYPFFWLVQLAVELFIDTMQLVVKGSIATMFLVPLIWLLIPMAMAANPETTLDVVEALVQFFNGFMNLFAGFFNFGAELHEAVLPLTNLFIAFYFKVIVIVIDVSAVALGFYPQSKFSFGRVGSRLGFEGPGGGAFYDKNILQDTVDDNIEKFPDRVGGNGDKFPSRRLRTPPRIYAAHEPLPSHVLHESHEIRRHTGTLFHHRLRRVGRLLVDENYFINPNVNAGLTDLEDVQEVIRSFTSFLGVIFDGISTIALILLRAFMETIRHIIQAIQALLIYLIPELTCCFGSLACCIREYIDIFVNFLVDGINIILSIFNISLPPARIACSSPSSDFGCLDCQCSDNYKNLPPCAETRYVCTRVDEGSQGQLFQEEAIRQNVCGEDEVLGTTVGSTTEKGCPHLNQDFDDGSSVSDSTPIDDPNRLLEAWQEGQCRVTCIRDGRDSIQLKRCPGDRRGVYQGTCNEHGHNTGAELHKLDKHIDKFFPHTTASARRALLDHDAGHETRPIHSKKRRPTVEGMGTDPAEPLDREGLTKLLEDMTDWAHTTGANTVLKGLNLDCGDRDAKGGGGTVYDTVCHFMALTAHQADARPPPPAGGLPSWLGDGFFGRGRPPQRTAGASRRKGPEGIRHAPPKTAAGRPHAPLAHHAMRLVHGARALSDHLEDPTVRPIDQLNSITRLLDTAHTAFLNHYNHQVRYHPAKVIGGHKGSAGRFLYGVATTVFLGRRLIIQGEPNGPPDQDLSDPSNTLSGPGVDFDVDAGVFSSESGGSCEYLCPNRKTCVKLVDIATCPTPGKDEWSFVVMLQYILWWIRSAYVTNDLRFIISAVADCWEQYDRNPDLDPTNFVYRVSAGTLTGVSTNYIYCFPLQAPIPRIGRFEWSFRKYVDSQCESTLEEGTFCTCKRWPNPRDINNYVEEILPGLKVYVVARIIAAFRFLQGFVSGFAALGSLATSTLLLQHPTYDSWSRVWESFWLWAWGPSAPADWVYLFSFEYIAAGGSVGNFIFCAAFFSGPILWTIVPIFLFWVLKQAYWATLKQRLFRPVLGLIVFFLNWWLTEVDRDEVRLNEDDYDLRRRLLPRLNRRPTRFERFRDWARPSAARVANAPWLVWDRAQLSAVRLRRAIEKIAYGENVQSPEEDERRLRSRRQASVIPVDRPPLLRPRRGNADSSLGGLPAGPDSAAFSLP